MKARGSDVVDVGRQKLCMPGRWICAKREKEQKNIWEQQHRENRRTLPSLPDWSYFYYLTICHGVEGELISSWYCVPSSDSTLKRHEGEPTVFPSVRFTFTFLSLPFLFVAFLFYFPRRYPFGSRSPLTHAEAFFVLVTLLLSFVSVKEKMHILFSWCCFFFWESLI